MPQLTVGEASVAYTRAMRNVLPANYEAVCEICRTFIAPQYDQCRTCNRQPNYLDAVVPITYSEHLGQMHTALRGYKDDAPEVRAYTLPRLTAILWRFLAAHEDCVARAAGVTEFDLVASVPSSTPDADDARPGLRTLVEWCQPIAGRYERILRPTGDVPSGRGFSASRYVAGWRIDGVRVLLIDDTWASGGHAQSAAYTLRGAGAASVALVVIGRHLRREWEVTEGVTCGDLFDELPASFDWNRCAAE